MKHLVTIILLLVLSVDGIAQSVTIEPTGNITSAAGTPKLNLNSTTIPIISNQRYMGTFDAPSAVTSGAGLMRINASGFNGTGISNTSVRISASATDDWSPTSNPGKLSFFLTPKGSTNLVQRLTILDNGNIGVSENLPKARLDILNSSDSDTNASIRLQHTTLDGFNRISFENGSANHFIISSNANPSAQLSRFHLYFKGLGNVFSATGAGNIGIGNPNPSVPLHVNSNRDIASAGAASAIIGERSQRHLNFGQNRIQSYENNDPEELQLNFEGGAVKVGSLIPGLIGGANANLDISGFTRLGITSPSIKLLKLTGITDNDATTTVAHGLDKSKILAVEILIENTAGNLYAPSGNGLATINDQYRYFVSTNNINLRDVGANLQGQNYRILITYEL